MSHDVAATTVDRIAAKLEVDILRRGLRPGDRYLTAAEAGKLFDVSSMMMHRAMSALADRELLVRRRSRGTFVGPKFTGAGGRQHQFDILHIVMAMDYHRTQPYSSDVLVDEFVQALPGVTVEVHHLVEGAVDRYVDLMLSRVGQSAREGFVLMRCPRSVQVRMTGAGLPTVVYGQTYPGANLPCVKHDQESVGRELAGFALSRGARRFALLMHAHWRLGDHKMIDSAMATLAAAGVPLDSVIMRSLPPDEQVVSQIVGQSLGDPNPPEAFLCRNDFYAEIVRRAIVARFGDDADGPLVASGGHSPPDETTAFPRVASSLSLRKQVDALVRLLADGGDLEPEQQAESVVIPVGFKPSGASSGSNVNNSRVDDSDVNGAAARSA